MCSLSRKIHIEGLWAPGVRFLLSIHIPPTVLSPSISLSAFEVPRVDCADCTLLPRLTLIDTADLDPMIIRVILTLEPRPVAFDKLKLNTFGHNAIPAFKILDIDLKARTRRGC